MTKKKVEGVINNGEENGEWVFYSEEGYVSQGVIIRMDYLIENGVIAFRMLTVS